MKNILFLLILIPVLANAQVIRRGGGSSTPDSTVWAKQTDLLHDATNSSEMPYVAAGDTLKSRPIYSAPCWTLDSTVLSLYGTSFNRTWFRTTADSLAVDSLASVLSGAATDTVTWRVLYGFSRTSPIDSLPDLKVYSLTTVTTVAATKVIPPYCLVWVKVIEKDGTPSSGFLSLDARRRW